MMNEYLGMFYVSILFIILIDDKNIDCKGRFLDILNCVIFFKENF